MTHFLCKNLLKRSLYAALCFISSSLFSANIPPHTEKGANVSVPSLRQEQKENHNLRIAEEKQQEEQAMSYAYKKEELLAKYPLFAQEGKAEYHFIKEISPNDGFISFTDGSGWSVREKDQYIAKNWVPGQFLEIRPNDASLFSRSDCMYKFYDPIGKTSVQAHLSKGPFKNNFLTKRITYCSHVTQKIVLSDKTTWNIASTSLNTETFRNWMVGDYIIIGTNNWYWYDWFGFWPPQILINVSDNSYITVYPAY